MKTFIEHGEVLEIASPSGGAKSGDLIIQGIVFGIAAHDAVEGDPLRIRPGGVHEKAAATGQAWTQGQAIYWDATAKAFTSTVGSNTKVGYAFVAKGSAAAVGRVKLNTSF